METCRLCLQPAALRNSHIIPEFLYQPGYDKKHRLIKLEIDVPKKQFLQKGLREALFCDSCEQLLNKNYEEPFLKVWQQTLPRPANNPEYLIKNLPYREFKLFLLSVLWRAGVATRKPFLKVNLGDKHEAKIRSMLWNHDPGKPMEYPILCEILINPDNRMPIEGTVMSPVSKRVEGQRSYTFIFGGCAWRYVVSSHPIKNLSRRILSASGALPAKVISIMDFLPFDSAMREHVQQIKRFKKKEDTKAT